MDHCLLGKHAKYKGFTRDDECRICEGFPTKENVKVSS